jgi:hypothetical protein
MQNPEPLGNPEAERAAGSSVLRHAALIMWPSFLAACLLEALVFALVDPGEIHWFGQMPQPSRQSVYSVAFFLFWLITMACSGMVLWLARTEQKINAQSAQKFTDKSVG